MTDWGRIPLRCVASLSAPPEAGRRALRTTQTWIRAATATGGEFQPARRSEILQAGQLVRFRPRRLVRPMVLVVEQDGELPRLAPATTAGITRIRIVPAVVPSAGGCSASVRFEWLGRSPMVDFSVRRALIRYGELLLGIAALVAAEPVAVVAGAIVADGKVLLTRRRTGAADGAAAGRWELPGGKVKPGETEQQALQRELLEELGIETVVQERIGPPIEMPSGITLFCYRANRIGGDGIVLVDHDEYCWVSGAELESLDLLDADRQLIAPLRTALSAG